MWMGPVDLRAPCLFVTDSLHVTKSPGDLMPTVTLNAGTIHYETAGPSDGQPVVFIHGYMMGSSLWRPLTERLAARGHSCLAPTWPLGAHTEPMSDGVELTVEGIAAMVGELLDALALEDVVLVGNDTGGVVAQLVAT